MEYRTECGYKGHVCSYGNGVQFISRYRGINDYCVGGHRVSLSDTGEWRSATKQQKDAVRWFLLDEYCDYLRWNRECRAKYQYWNYVPKFDHASAF